jgi:hypothetical protein
MKTTNRLVDILPEVSVIASIGESSRSDFDAFIGEPALEEGFDDIGTCRWDEAIC